MVNLNTCFPLCPERIGSARELPVLVDLNWLGRVMTSENGGIIPSRAAVARPAVSTIDTHEIIL